LKFSSENFIPSTAQKRRREGSVFRKILVHLTGS